MRESAFAKRPAFARATAAKLADTPARKRAAGQKQFDNEWILDALTGHPGFFTKRMFGGLAAYLFGRQMLVLVEPTRTGRWQWHGVLVCTGHEHHEAIRSDFPHLRPHEVLGKWLYLDSRHDHFETTMTDVAAAIARDDERFGIHPVARAATARRRRARR